MNIFKKILLIAFVVGSGNQMFAKPSVRDFLEQVQYNDSLDQFEQLVKKFVQEGGDINEKCENETLLGVYMSYGYSEHVQILLNCGAKRNNLAKYLSISFDLMQNHPEKTIGMMKAINLVVSTMSEKDRNKQIYQGLITKSGIYEDCFFQNRFVDFAGEIGIASELLNSAINNGSGSEFDSNLIEFKQFFQYLIAACYANNDEKYSERIANASSRLKWAVYLQQKNSAKIQYDQLQKIDNVASEIYSLANNLA